jgi:hypothetical protein
VMQTLRTIGDGAYAVDWKVLDTQDHGVPQSRQGVCSGYFFCFFLGIFFGFLSCFLAPWALGPWAPGPLVPWAPGPLGPWFRGSPVPWVPGPLGPRSPGPLGAWAPVPWAPGHVGPGFLGFFFVFLSALVEVL